MRRSTELVVMIAGCAALVVAAILLPALLLAPATKVEQAAKGSRQAPVADASQAPSGEPPRLPPVSQLPDQPMPFPSEPAGPPEQAAVATPNEPKEAAKPNEPMATASPNVASETAKPSDQVAVVSPGESKEVAKPNEPTVAATPNVASEAAKPSDQVAVVSPGEPKEAAKPEPAPAANQGAASEASTPSAPGAPPEPSKLPEVAKPPEAVASLPGEPKDVAKAEEKATGDVPATGSSGREGGQVRSPWWCSNPRGNDVEAVCGSRELLALDAELNALYSRLVAREQNAELRNAQRRWLVQRQGCGVDVACLKRHYEKRIAELARM